MKEAALWTDGRYYLQASNELEPSIWTLMKQGLSDTPTIADWLNLVLPSDSNSNIGVDPTLISKGQANTIQSILNKKGHKLISISENLIDAIWENKPALPSNPAFVHELKYSGVSHQDKIVNLRRQIKEKDCYAIVVAALDEIAWLLNIRGNDVNFNPVVISYVLVTEDYLKLYIDNNKVSQDVKLHLGENIVIVPYKQIFADLIEINKLDKKVWLDPIKSNYALFENISSNNIVELNSPITLDKSIKNETELNGFRECHIRDAVALINYFSWLETKLEEGEDSNLNEVSVADRLDMFRSEQPLFVSLSFETISGFGPNGAIIHYKPEKETCAKISKDSLYLCDSGGQYKDGTTDVTRTLHFGTPTTFQKQCFTRVLQGVIALDTAIFPNGTIGRELDILARAPLWKVGLDYRHGTGHGVGSFLNVHEGPQSISFRDSPYKQPMLPGMTITDEPGYYQDGDFGIRIENVLVVKDANTENNFGNRGYLGFEHVTVVPIQTKLIDVSLLTPAEIKWVNDYHQECLTKLTSKLQGKALEWLIKETKPLVI